eukprot:12357460-Alexandrium_andersonii.AAC.1
MDICTHAHTRTHAYTSALTHLTFISPHRVRVGEGHHHRLRRRAQLPHAQQGAAAPMRRR